MKQLEALRSTDSAVRDVYRAIDDAPMPGTVLELFDTPSAAGQTDNVVAFPARGFRQFLQAPVAIAASVALMAGFLLADIFRQDINAPIGDVSLVAGTIDAQSGLHTLLEESASGVPQDVGDGATAELVLSFENTAGDYCRQLMVADTARAAHGVACRRGDTWQMEMVAYGAAAAANGQFTPAAGNTPAAVSALVDGLIGTGEPLDQDTESRLISTSWEKSAN